MGKQPINHPPKTWSTPSERLDRFTYPYLSYSLFPGTAHTLYYAYELPRPFLYNYFNYHNDCELLPNILKPNVEAALKHFTGHADNFSPLTIGLCTSIQAVQARTIKSGLNIAVAALGGVSGAYLYRFFTRQLPRLLPTPIILKNDTLKVKV